MKKAVGPHWGPKIGGKGGRAYFIEAARITGARLWSKNSVLAMQFQIDGQWLQRWIRESTEVNEEDPKLDVDELVLEDGEYFYAVEVQSGPWIYRVALKTNRGREIKTGRRGGGDVTSDGGGRMKMIGCEACCDDLVSSLRFQWVETDEEVDADTVCL